MLAIVVVGIALIRLRLADAPIERDEGEYAYAGQLILDGVPPYALVYNMKFPEYYYAYSLALAIFGQSSWGVHAGLLVVNAASTILMYLIGRRLLGELGGVIASVIFAVMTLDQGVLGAYAHATHFIVLPMLGGALLALRAGQSGGRLPWLMSGLLFGLAGVMSQKGVFFVPFGLSLVWWGRTRSTAGPQESMVRAVGLFAAGACLPFVAVGVALSAQGVLGNALFWTFGYARAQSLRRRRPRPGRCCRSRGPIPRAPRCRSGFLQAPEPSPCRSGGGRRRRGCSAWDWS